MQGKTKIRMGILAAGLVAAIAIGSTGIYAYMTDTDNGINIATIGDVHIKATEPNFPTEDKDGNGVPDDCELVIPYEEISKDPKIKNTGTNDAVVFLKITAPVEKLTLIDDDGKRLDETMADLFWFKQKDDPDTFHQNNWNSGWVELTELDKQFVTEEDCNIEGNGYTYIFGYHTRIAAGETTSTLFDKVQNKKYGSRTISANEVENIKIEAYAIQADNILRNEEPVVTNGEISEADLTYIYNTFFNQNQENLK